MRGSARSSTTYVSPDSTTRQRPWLNQNTNRDYDPLTAKYVESDPIGLNGGVNTYTYVRGNPIQRSDKKGLVDFCDEFGDCYINQTPACMSDPSACTDWHDPGDPKSLCTVACSLRVAALGQAEELTGDTALEYAEHALKFTINAFGRWAARGLFLANDGREVYECYKKCHEPGGCGGTH
jgi:RHS repeat-associated protein